MPSAIFSKQLDKAMVGVKGKSLGAGLLHFAPQGVAIHAEIENGIHHARHRDGQARTYLDQKGVVRVTEDFTCLFFQSCLRIAWNFEP